MKNIKKIITLLIFLVVILTISIICLIYFIKTNAKKEKIEDMEKIEESFNINNELKEIDRIDEYIYIKECINKYINYSTNIYYLTGEEDKEQIEETINQLKSIIPKFVIEKMNINNNNILNNIGIKDVTFTINNIYSSLQTMNTIEYEETSSIYAYYVEGEFINTTSYTHSDLKMVVILDLINSTFLIVPNQYLESEQIILSEGSKLKIYDEEVIEDEIYNIYDIRIINDEEKSNSYFTDLKNNILYKNYEYMYNLLDEEYRNNKFENISEFEKYIDQNFNNMRQRRLDKFVVKYNEDSKRYICKDGLNNIYIFEERKPMKYTIILDSYTIDLPEFTEKYNNSNSEIKVGLNIERILEAINYKDYKYAYNKLDETFKNNYFSDISKFETFIKTKFFDTSDIEYINMTTQGNIYIYEVTIKDTKSNNTNQLNIMVRLGEGTDYTISFNI